MYSAESRQLTRLLGCAGVDSVQVPLVVCDGDFKICASSVKRFGNIPVSDNKGRSMVSYMAESLPELIASSHRCWFRGRLEHNERIMGCLVVRGEIKGIRYYCFIEDYDTEKFCHAGLSPEILKTLDRLGENIADAVHDLVENGADGKTRLNEKWIEACHIYELIDTYCDTCQASAGKPTMSVESLVRMLTYISETVLKSHNCVVEYTSDEKEPHMSIYDDTVVTTLFSASLCLMIMVSGCSHNHIKIEVDDPDDEESCGKIVFSGNISGEWEHELSGDIGRLAKEVIGTRMLPIVFELSTAVELAKSIGWKSSYLVRNGKMYIEVHFKCARANEQPLTAGKARSSKMLEVTNVDRICAACVKYRRDVWNKRAAALSKSPSPLGRKTAIEAERESEIFVKLGESAEAMPRRTPTPEPEPVPVPMPLKGRPGSYVEPKG